MQTGNLAKWIDELQATIENLKKKVDAAAKATTGLPGFEVNNPEDGQFLIYDGSDSKWKNAGVEPGGGISITSLFTKPETAPQYGVDYELSDSIYNYDAIIIEYGQFTESRFVLTSMILTDEIKAIMDDNLYVFLSGWSQYGVHVGFDSTGDTFNMVSSISNTYVVFNIKGVDFS